MKICLTENNIKEQPANVNTKFDEGKINNSALEYDCSHLRHNAMALEAMGLLIGTQTALCPGSNINTGYKPFQNSAWEAGSASPAGQHRAP